MNILVWGAGYVAHEMLEKELKDTEITAFIDNKKEKIDGYKVYTPEEAVELEYDAIVVATGYAEEVYTQSKDLGYDLSKFVFIYNNYFFQDMNVNYELVQQIFGQEYTEVIKNRYHVIRGMSKDKYPSQICLGGGWNEGLFASDYSRIRTFELAVEEIRVKDVPGAVAELGVFRGEFARYINEAFPGKTCYLFDTFEGFRDCEAEKEKAAGNCGDVFVEFFKTTNEKMVLDKMPNPKQVILKKGLFPKSLEGMEDTFAFVSLDVDFEQAIYDGLEYFYSRLNQGGYIFIHDYNSDSLHGVKRAVYQYEKIYGISLAKVPLPDVCGTLVITK